MTDDRSYVVLREQETPGELLLHLGWGDSPAGNDRLVVDAVAAIRALGLQGGRLVKFNGPASLPVAMALCHEVCHLYGAVAVRDPKLGKYVVAVSHSPEFHLGQLID